MFFSKFKISTKLFISSIVFLVPIGVMLFFICSMTIGIIRKTMDEHDGIAMLKPAVTVMQTLPEYLNVYLGLEQGNLRSLDEQITGALRALDRGMSRYIRVSEQPNLLGNWETMKRIETNDIEFYHQYQDFAYSLVNVINRIGEHSGLILVSDINTYYFIDLVMSGIPEAYMG